MVSSLFKYSFLFSENKKGLICLNDVATDNKPTPSHNVNDEHKRKATARRRERGSERDAHTYREDGTKLKQETLHLQLNDANSIKFAHELYL